MKTAIYIENGATQIVLTPESDFEERAISGIATEDQEITIYRGGFYKCQGGWVRHRSESNSLILRVGAGPANQQQK
jgi:hypothetical protein